MGVIKKIFFWSGLAIFIVVLFFFMAFYSLPADKLIAATTQSLTKGRLQFKAQKVSLTLPASLKIEEALYGIFSGDTLTRDRFRSLTLEPDYKRILTGYFPVKFKGTMPRGRIQGKTGISIGSGLENGYFTIKTSDIFLEDLNILASLTERNITGKLRGEMNVMGNLVNPAKMDGKGRFYVEKGSIDTRINLPGMKTVSFEGIIIDFSLKRGIMVLKNSKIEGPMFSGIFSGEIALKKKIATSQLKITARVKPGPLLEDNHLLGQFLSRLRKGDNPVNIKILGTFERPSLHWGKI